MPAMSKLKEIETCRRKPMNVILRELYSEHGSQKAVADELKVSQSTVSTWLVRLGLKEHTILVPRSPDGENRSSSESAA